MSVIEFLYLASGIFLPLFYVPQILKLLKDDTALSSYSMMKSFAQFLLRVPTLLFAYFVVQHEFMNIVLTLDVLGRAIELAAAVISLRRQGWSARSISSRVLSLHSRFVESQQPS